MPTATSASTSEASPTEGVLSVTQLTARLKGVVEQQFSSVWVAGEISNFSRPQSGHCYFTLKDDNAQLRAVIWRGTAARLKFDVHDGLEVLCRGRLDVYPPRGSYQLVVDELQPQGIGALELALRKLREKLGNEGLFDPQRKRPLPTFPRRIGVVTSPTGAAVRDFLEVMRRRWSGVEVLIFPVRVQGEGAAEEIAAAIKQANRLLPALDVLVVTRGGGSLEDLWAFNEEPVVRALASSHIPTVSAIGHEIDVTLADLAADVRALTPSEAAERIVPSAQDVQETLRTYHSRLQNALSMRASSLRSRLEAIASRTIFARPLDNVHNLSRQIDDHATRLHAAMRLSIREQQSQLATLSGKLETLSPLGVLSRGYSLTHDKSTGKLITSVKKLKTDQRIVTRLAEGSFVSTIEKITKNNAN
ncbi:MAG: exodeoxyribonuclease VII large subunit [Planctomycetes bacterium]|nr:exodeoxyribonuclease VII large subunit [Planctomycetota bacterium]